MGVPFLNLELIPERHRAVNTEEFVLHLCVAVAYDRDIVLKIKGHLAARIETIKCRFAAVRVE